MARLLRPCWLIVVDVRAPGIRLRVPLPLPVVEDLLASFEPWAWLADRALGRFTNGVMGHLADSSHGSAVRLGEGFGDWIERPVSRSLHLALSALRALRGMGSFTLVDVSGASGERVRIRLV